MNTAVHFSSATDEWETPQELFDQLAKEFLIAVDVCATAGNAKCDHYYDREDDSLSQDWADNTPPGFACWMNPPYGRMITRWVGKAWQTSKQGVTVVCLLPARTDTGWWHEFIWDTAKHAPQSGVEVRLLRGRLKFGGSKNSAPFPSAVVIFHAQRQP